MILNIEEARDHSILKNKFHVNPVFSRSSATVISTVDADATVMVVEEEEASSVIIVCVCVFMCVICCLFVCFLFQVEVEFRFNRVWYTREVCKSYLVQMPMAKSCQVKMPITELCQVLCRVK